MGESCWVTADSGGRNPARHSQGVTAPALERSRSGSGVLPEEVEDVDFGLCEFDDDGDEPLDS